MFLFSFLLCFSDIVRLDPRNLKACTYKTRLLFRAVRVSSRDNDSTTREKVSMVEDARETRRRGEKKRRIVGFFGMGRTLQKK